MLVRFAQQTITPRAIQPGGKWRRLPSAPVARAISPHTQVRCLNSVMASGCGWICLRQITFVPNACGQIARATDGCVLSPRSGHRNPAGFACGKLRSCRTLAGRLPALRMAASFRPGPVVETRLDLPCGKLRSCRTPGRAPLGGSASPTRTGERGQAVLVPTGLCSQPFLSLGKESADPIWADGFFCAFSFLQADLPWSPHLFRVSGVQDLPQPIRILSQEEGLMDNERARNRVSSV